MIIKAEDSVIVCARNDEELSQLEVHSKNLWCMCMCMCIFHIFPCFEDGGI